MCRILEVLRSYNVPYIRGVEVIMCRILEVLRSYNVLYIRDVEKL